jgi:hypothetical protein
VQRALYVRVMSFDPTVTGPDKYTAIFENDRVRVLEYKDKPGDRTSPHRHPDSVMYTLRSFRRRLVHGDRAVDVEIEAGRVGWLGAQEHRGENIGETDSHALFIELNEPDPAGHGRPATLRSARLNRRNRAGPPAGRPACAVRRAPPPGPARRCE